MKFKIIPKYSCIAELCPLAGPSLPFQVPHPDHIASCTVQGRSILIQGDVIDVMLPRGQLNLPGGSKIDTAIMS